MRPLAIRTVLAATDLSASSDLAVGCAYRLASAAGAALHIVHVYPSAASEEERELPGREAHAREVDAVLQRAGIPERRVKVHAVPGSPAEAIRTVSLSIHADVIVLGPPRGTGSDERERRLGGTARAVAVRASAPCLAALRPLPLPLSRVVVPVDLSDTARGALLVALSWASALRTSESDGRKTTLVAVHVSGVEDDAARDAASALASELASLRRSAGDWAGVAIEGETVSGQAGTVESIARFADAQHADLLVLGTRGLGLDAAERLGSISAEVIERSPVPVLLVPPSVWHEHLED
jgi:nucleotide-binding universal stress UspA family protein